MSSFRSLIFTRPRALRSASREALRAFLEPHADFLTAQGGDFNERCASVIKGMPRL
jgi:hypothetical protein